MSRKSVLLGAGTLVLLTSLVALVLLGLILREPSFYQRCVVPPGQEREELSRQFFSRFWTLLDDLHERRDWEARFTQEQINSFLDHDFVRSNLDRQILPEGLTEPRIAIDQDGIRLAIRYHVGRWSTVVAIDMRVWLAAGEPNVLALELRGMRLGTLPASAQALLERLTEAAERNNIKVSWYRLRGNPVAVLRFQADQQRAPAVQLDRFELHPGLVMVHGRSVEPEGLTARPSEGVTP